MNSPAIRVLQLTVLALAVPIALIHGNSSNTPAASTGAPGDGLCNQCHFGTPNSRRGKVEAQFATLLTYKAGAKQRISVRIYPRSDGGGSRGFQITARLGSNELQQAGTFTTVDSSTTSQIVNGIQYVNHAVAQGANSYAGTTVFLVDWTPPSANVGNIKFYVSAVDGAADFQANANDAVYTANYTLTPDSRDLPDGFRWTTIDAGTSTDAFGISNDGRIVGSYLSGTQRRGYLRAANGDLTAFVFPGASATYAYGVNTAGTVVGAYDDVDGKRHGFVRTAAGVFTTRDVPGAISTTLYGINDAGRIVGTYLDFNSFTHGLIFEPSGALQIFDSPEATATYGYGINTTGVVSAGYNGRGVLRNPDGYFIDSLLCAIAVPSDGASWVRLNDFNDLTGVCTTTAPAQGTITRTSYLRSSNGRLAQPQRRPPVATNGDVLYGINNGGQIVGSGDGKGLLLTPCSLTLNGTGANVDAAGSTGSVSVTGPSDCIPVLSTDADWITVQPNGSYFVAASSSAQLRTGNIYLGSQTFTITQGSVACTYTFTGGQSTVNSTGGTSTVSITAPTGCLWSALSTVPWITILSTNPNPGTGSGSLNYSVESNPGTFSRSGAILIGGQQFVINQLGGNGCGYQVFSATTSFTVDGGQGLVSVTAPINCPWTSTSNDTWIAITSGFSTSGTGQAYFTVSPNTSAAARTGSVRVAGQTIFISQAGLSSSSALRFVPITPCRVADTRAEGGKTGSFGPPSLTAQTTREIPIPNSGCNVPSNARAYSLNVTAVPAGYLGYLTIYPTGQAQPTVSTLNSWNGRVVANAAIVPAGTNGSISLFVSDPSNVVVDINGYFVSASQAEGLVFYPLAPCRVADTRTTGGKSGEYGPPGIAGGTSRTMSIPGSGCGVPSSAQAFSLNVTAVPSGPLGYLTMWPGGQAQPFVSTLNSFDGQVVANAAIVPAGFSGTVSVFASNNSDVIVDINGYFAPAGGANALNFYTIAPCRAVDTRTGSGKIGSFGPPQISGGTSRTIGLVESGCGLPSSAQAYSLNVTALPLNALSFLTAWPAGSTQPVVSTLNSFNGQVVANAALLPAGLGGGINIFVSDTADVLIDLNGYFAQ